jgi:hypothetical protein
MVSVEWWKRRGRGLAPILTSVHSVQVYIHLAGDLSYDMTAGPEHSPMNKEHWVQVLIAPGRRMPARDTRRKGMHDN